MPPSTLPLARFPAPLPWDVYPMGRVDASGRVAWEPGVLPPEGDVLLVAWRPGERPPFEALRGALARRGGAWRFSAPPASEAWVLLVARV